MKSVAVFCGAARVSKFSNVRISETSSGWTLSCAIKAVEPERDGGVSGDGGDSIVEDDPLLVAFDDPGDGTPGNLYMSVEMSRVLPPSRSSSLKAGCELS